MRSAHERSACVRFARAMHVRLLGTGSAEGWPSPWCSCASCRATARAGVLRASASALVDDRLLLELGPDAPRAAVRAGTDLTGVEAVLVTHAHPDHFHWPAWMWRGWAAGNRAVVLVAPPAFLLGMSFPIAQKAVQQDPAVVGRNVGIVQLANILGNTAGAVVTGLVLLHLLGTAGTLRAIGLLGLLMPVAQAAHSLRPCPTHPSTRPG